MVGRKALVSSAKTPPHKLTRSEALKAKRRAERLELGTNAEPTGSLDKSFRRFKTIGTVTGRFPSDGERLIHLGNKVFAADNPADAIIETVVAPRRAELDSNDLGDRPWVRFICSEFTSLCPVTGQPDFATFVIDYVPNSKLIESKSLKLFIGSFRSYAGFAEAVTAMIADRLYLAAEPQVLVVEGYWAARGGIPIHVFEKRGGSIHVSNKRPPPVNFFSRAF